jgi:four helix bundle protein
MMHKFRFRKFPVYQLALEFDQALRELTAGNFPKKEQFVLTSQLLRAGDSVVLNIAEGTDRSSDKDFGHFLNIAHTSLNEVVACLDIALQSKYILSEPHLYFLEKAENLANQLTAFRKSILDNPTK